MEGRKVKNRQGETGEVVKWKPLDSSMCEALVKNDATGRDVWHTSRDLQPVDGLGPLPSRQDAREAARVEAIRSLQAIKVRHIQDFNKSWPGCEHGKTIIGKTLNAAIEEMEWKSH